ncbi:hypothetical protein VTN00DRAFT_816 [Thermoascus crustaceus]|uniref:uncharacterized protein n=1 Tax=Thermoascus crustaceus TaxID=5088 RepID=UPI00374429F6
MLFYSIALYRGDKGAMRMDFGYYLLTTPDRETVDLFYRHIQTVKDFSIHRFYNLKRLSAQTWTWEASDYRELGGLIEKINYLAVKTTEDRFAKLPGRIIFSQLDAHHWVEKRTFDVPTIPHVEGPDRVSGMEVFIRSKRYPEKFWYLQRRSVVLSPTRRSKFRIELASNRNDRETLLITDDIVLTGLGPEKACIKFDWNRSLKTDAPGSGGTLGDNIRYDKNSTCGEDFEFV